MSNDASHDWLAKPRYYIERFGPLSVAIATSFILYKYREKLSFLSASDEIDIPILYSAIFDWSAIQTGFLFGIFGYVGGKSNGFIAKIKDTSAMRLFLGYTRTAIWLGFILTFASILLMVSQFSISGGEKWRFVVFAVWSGLAVWAFFAFLRVAYLFGLLLRPSDKEEARG